MTDKDPASTNCLTFTKAISQIRKSDVPIHLGKAFREVLLAMRTVADTIIESKEKRNEVKFQRVTIE
jgi:hypothetical protein